MRSLRLASFHPRANHRSDYAYMNPSLLDILDPATADFVPPPTDAQGKTESHDGPLEAGERGTDLDASLRFAEAYADDLRHCPGIGWLYWDGRRWTSEGAEGHAL